MIDISEQATVVDIHRMLSKIIRKGRGRYVVTCNDEYVLAKKGDKPVIKDDSKEVDLGGYC